MYNNIISTDNLLAAWKEFLKGKRKKKDVQDFQYRLADNILGLHEDLRNKTYAHGDYHHFKVFEPKERDIHKASVRDRLLQHAIYRRLYPYFDPTFIYDSYSCRKRRGTHRALKRFTHFSRVASKNHTKTLWVLKCDVKKFFASIDQDILIHILEKYVVDLDVIWLIQNVVQSFKGVAPVKGLPLGNLTSQLLVNIYMNKFDHFMKQAIRAEYYIRYADDFVIMNTDKDWLVGIVPMIQKFLADDLALQLHPKKLSITTLASGIDFLGWVHFPDHKTLRTTTKKRMLNRLEENPKKPEIVQSYLGLLSHGNTQKLKRCIKNL
ncbi:MAG: reverse transcriptase/maturase family protein [Candidatus Taylorbacteria bacterium]